MDKNLVFEKALKMANSKPMVGPLKIHEHVDSSRPVKVYWNLHKNCLSVQQDGLVKCHATGVQLHSFEAIVNPAGREKVRREKRKTVHAFIKGMLFTPNTQPLIFDLYQLTYNPYVNNHWTEKETGRHVEGGAYVEIVNRRVWASGFTYLKGENLVKELNSVA